MELSEQDRNLLAQWADSNQGRRMLGSFRVGPEQSEQDKRLMVHRPDANQNRPVHDLIEAVPSVASATAEFLEPASLTYANAARKAYDQGDWGAYGANTVAGMATAVPEILMAGTAAPIAKGLDRAILSPLSRVAMDAVNSIGKRAPDISPAAFGGAVTAGAVMQPGEAEASPAGFYSRLERFLSSPKLQRSGSGKQWLNTLRNSPDVPSPELNIRGVDRFLKEASDNPVGLGELRDFVEKNPIPLSHRLLKGAASPYEGLTLPGDKSNYTTNLFNLTSPEELYTSGHYGTQNGKNLAFHTRTTDRDFGDGPMKFLEEVQSDWAKKIRKYGEMLPEEEYEKRMDTLLSEHDALRAFARDRHVQPGENVNSYLDELLELESKIRATRTQISDLASVQDHGAPPLPFAEEVGGTPLYAQIGFRKALLDAAEEDLPTLGWTTGDQQVRRYWGDDPMEWDPTKKAGMEKAYDKDLLKIAQRENRRIMGDKDAIQRTSREGFDIDGADAQYYLNDLDELFGNTPSRGKILRTAENFMEEKIDRYDVLRELVQQGVRPNIALNIANEIEALRKPREPFWQMSLPKEVRDRINKEGLPFMGVGALNMAAGEEDAP